MCRRFGTSPKCWTLLVRAAPNAPAADSWEASASQMVEKLPAPESLKAFVLQKNGLFSKKGLAETRAAPALRGGLVRGSVLCPFARPLRTLPCHLGCETAACGV